MKATTTQKANRSMILAGLKRMLRSMLCLERDQNDYTIDGIDVVPERPPRQNETISRLVKLLQDANHREEAARRSADALNRKYHSLYQEYMALKHSDYCEACQLKKDTSPKGDTLTLCAECGEVQQTIARLKLELEKKEEQRLYWQDCYETALSERYQSFPNPDVSDG